MENKKLEKKLEDCFYTIDADKDKEGGHSFHYKKDIINSGKDYLLGIISYWKSGRYFGGGSREGHLYLVYENNGKIDYKELIGLGCSNSEDDPIRIDTVDEKDNKITIKLRDVNESELELTLFRDEKGNFTKYERKGFSLVQIPEIKTIVLG